MKKIINKNLLPNIEYDIFYEYEVIGEVSNANSIISLKKNITNYDFLIVESGYGYSKSQTMIPVNIFINRGSSYNQCTQYVKTFNGYGVTSIKYVSETQIQINGEIGTDVITRVYGIKMQSKKS